MASCRRLEEELPPLDKWFVPLENNPQVFTQLARDLGLSPSWTFHDVYSLTEPELLNMVPRPVQALIFTTPGETFHRARDVENDAMVPHEANVDKDSVIWFEQTLRNSCGLMAFLHATLNSVTRDDLLPGSVLQDLRDRAVGLSVAGRSRLLEHSAALETAHASAANLGDTAAPPIPQCPPNHYIAFVRQRDGTLWELNGGMKGPVCRGTLDDSKDALSDTALDLTVQSFLKHAEGDARFTVVALACTGD
ncbi:hypothetical protein E4T39_07653 [Aureobasidium subglaciale]|nr:hypothetical protein E4T39_07653 [Aureobasidium subglaciale]